MVMYIINLPQLTAVENWNNVRFRDVHARIVLLMYMLLPAIALSCDNVPCSVHNFC